MARFAPSRATVWACATALGLGLGAGMAERWPSWVGATDSIFITGAERVPTAELVRSAAVPRGVPFSALDLEDVSARVAAHPWVLEARATALPPDTLLLEIVEREPRATVWLGTPEQPWLVDGDGTPFARAAVAGFASPGGVPQIRGTAGLEPERPHPELAQAVRILEALEARGLPAPQEVELSGEDPRAVPSLLLTELSGRRLRVVLGGGPLEPKLERLARILSANRPETAEAEVIDVRFAGQVILRSGPSSEEGEATDERGNASPS
jgi:hypothetical protein